MIMLLINLEVIKRSGKLNVLKDCHWKIENIVLQDFYALLIKTRAFQSEV